jgi:DNA-binding transcriptional LysR family regulator
LIFLVGVSILNFAGIEAFLSIVENKSLSKAAEKLHLSQSSISHRLKMLEQELNVELIQRNQGQRSIVLTPKGEEFIVIAKRWMALWKDTSVWKAEESLLKLNIGCVDSLNAYVFSSLYKKLIDCDTPLTIRVGTHWSVTLHNLIESYEVDVAFVLWQVKSKNILSRPLFSERMVLVSLTESSFPELVHPKELNPADEIYLNSGPGFEEWHNYWWDSAKHSNTKVDTAALIISFLDKPTQWSIVPMSMARSFQKLKSIKISELSDPPPERVCHKITHRYPKPSRIKSLEVFEKYLEEFIASDNLISLIK